MVTIIRTNTFQGTPWWEQIYLDQDGNYGVATFKYESIKADSPCFLEPAGE